LLAHMDIFLVGVQWPESQIYAVLSTTIAYTCILIVKTAAVSLYFTHPPSRFDFDRVGWIKETAAIVLDQEVLFELVLFRMPSIR
jgi:hypothetical protein